MIACGKTNASETNTNTLPDPFSENKQKQPANYG